MRENLIVALLVLSCSTHCIFGFVVSHTLTWTGGTQHCEQYSPRGDYACSNGFDQGDWANGQKILRDQQKDLSYVVTQVNASIEGSFDCKEGVGVIVLLDDTLVGYFSIPKNDKYYCSVCSDTWFMPGALYIESRVYPNGWPSFTYNAGNNVSIQLVNVGSESSFCLSQLTMNLTFGKLPLPDPHSSQDGSDGFHFDAPTWFWTLVILFGVITVVLVIVFFSLWRKSQQGAYNSMGYRPLSAHEYVDPSQLEDIRIDSDQLVLHQEIGRGSFGQVFKGTWRGTEVAVKKIPANCLRESETREFMKEAFILRQLRHPNVLQVLGASLNPALIVTEFMPRGNLFQLIHDTTVPLPWHMVRKMALDVCKGMSYLHGCTPPLIHRDLKPHNLLVDENWRVKVCDFGLSKFVENINAMTACGTPAYAAPEVLRNSDYSTSADVYSFGIVLWELVTREVLYPTMPPFQIIFAVGTQKSRPALPPTIPAVISSLIQECWDEDPGNRPSFLVIADRLSEMDDDVH